MGKSKSAAATVQPIESSERPKASPEAPINAIVAALSADERSAVAWVEGYRWKRNATGQRTMRTKVIRFPTGDGGEASRVEAWEDLTNSDLAAIWGGGEISVACRGERGIIKWVSLWLEGPEPVAELEAPASDVPATPPPAASAAGVVSIPSALGQFPVLEGLDPLARALWVLGQQQQLQLREQYSHQLAVLRADADARVRDAQTFARSVVEVTTAAQNTAQTLSQSFFAAVQAMNPPEAPASDNDDKPDKTMAKLLFKLLDREKNESKDLAKRLDDFREKMDELKKSGSKKDQVAAWRELFNDVMDKGPTAIRAFRELMKEEDDAYVAKEFMRRLNGEPEVKAHLEAQARSARQAEQAARLDPTAQPVQPPTPEVRHVEQEASPPAGGNSSGGNAGGGANGYPAA